MNIEKVGNMEIMFKLMMLEIVLPEEQLRIQYAIF